MIRPQDSQPNLSESYQWIHYFRLSEGYHLVLTRAEKIDGLESVSPGGGGPIDVYASLSVEGEPSLGYHLDG